MHISISNLENTQSYLISQENYSHSQNIPLSSKFSEDNYILPTKGRKYRNAEMQFIDAIILWCPTQGSTTQQSSSQISAFIKRGRSAANEGIRRALKNGVVKVIRKQIDKKLWATNIYSLADEWYDPVFRQRMRTAFPNLDDSIAQPKREKMKYKEMNKQVMRENIAIQKVRRVSEIDNFQSHEICPEDIDIPSDSSREVVAQILFADNDNIMVKKQYDLQKTDILLKGNIYTRACDDGWISEFGYEPVTSFLNKKEEKPENEQSFTKKEVAMSQETLYNKILVPVTSSLKSIRVTIWGQIRLSCFPDEAILYADQQLLRSSKNIDDRWKYFRGICEAYCKNNNIVVQWQTMLKLGQQYAMPNDGPFIDLNFIAEKPVTSSVKRSSTSSFNPGERNRALVQEYAPHLLDSIKPKQTIEEELEELKTTDPKRYEWRVKYAQDLLLACGRDPITGDALPHFNQAEASVVLQKALGIPEEIVEDYSSDPFGDFK